MRKFLLLGFMVASFYSTAVWGQYNCPSDALDSIKAFYVQDAEQIFVRSLLESNMDAKNEIRLPSEELEMITAALLAIYDNTELPHWDEIIEQYQVHAKQELATHSIRLLVDYSILYTTADFSSPKLKESGNEELDQTFHDFNFSIDGQPKFVAHENDPTAYLELFLTSSEALNLEPLLQNILKIKGVIEASAFLETNLTETEKDITFTKFSDHLQFTFRYSWECGEDNICVNNHYWTYKVYTDCSSVFVEETGSVLPVREITSLIATGIYPNPTTDKVFVQFLGPTGKDIHVVLFSALGQILQSEYVRSQSGLIKLDFSMKELPVGMYFLGLVSEGKVLTEKILKR